MINPLDSPRKMAMRLRKWQSEAVDYLIANHGLKRGHLFAVSGGGGKTMFACAAMREMQRKGYTRFIVVSPGYSVKKSFADTAARFGIQLDCNSTTRLVKGFHGLSLTYAALRNCQWLATLVDDNTMVVLDEPHHLEEDEGSRWYQDALKVLGHAGLIVMMTGTPWRSSGGGRIPFCTYGPVEGNKFEIVPDYSYPYSEALRDNVVARARFTLCRGVARWTDGRGAHEIQVGRQGVTAEQEGRALRSLTRIGGEFMDGMLGDALHRLGQVRTGDNNYGLLILCPDVDHARATVARLRSKFGVRADLAVGDDSGAHREITKFRDGTADVLVTVLMVSEGTDIPRVKVVLYASHYKTYLFFCQVMYRAARKTKKGREDFHMLVPALPTFTMYTRMIEEETRHVVKEMEEKEGAGNGEGVQQGVFIPGDSEYGGADTYDLREYPDSPEPPLTDRRDALRGQCSDAVRQMAARVVKANPALDLQEVIRSIHTQANALAGGVKQEEMDDTELEAKLEVLRTWLARGVKRA